MDFSEYQLLAKRTEKFPPNVAMLYTALGLAGEAGEVANALKRVYRDDAGVLTVPRTEEILDELGDCLWYISSLAGVIGVALEEVAKHNIEKLERRAAAGTIHGKGGKR